MADQIEHTPTVAAADIFLDDEERYEVFVVKSAERPHLLDYQGAARPSVDCCCSRQDQEEKKEDSGRCDGSQADVAKFDDLPLPLVDGCDLPGFRCHGLACDRKSDEVSGRLNIGPGSALFRRSEQLSYPSRPVDSAFGKLMHELASIPPSSDRDADVVDSSRYSELVDIEGSHVKASRFAVEYERRNIPAKIVGATSSWKAMPCACDDNDNIGTRENIGWTFDNLVKRFGDMSWRFSDVHGEMLDLSTYRKYISTLEGLADDSPLAIYDAEVFDDDSPASELFHEYSVPSCFSDDLFDLADGDTRPPWRWILIGPERSGTGLHIDPLWTNAWVTVLQGKKRWLLFPPNTPHEEIGMFADQPQIVSSVWFRDYYNKVTSPGWPEEWRPIEVLQHPGETVFVPNGWPHLVLNLELTIALTHNYASEFGPFERMWEEVATTEQNFGLRWYSGMLTRRKDLADRVKKYHIDAVNKGKEWAVEFGDLSTIQPESNLCIC